ncbi:YecA family protein [Lentibacillus saliphilus]|uniref:YecA family protein n=1 Tax=Lentibacillus saliphilus TaxID=2737028 RepID=UPI001FECAC2D|nr:SEC-C metal-binding domain-containing protein [Lentibacillus saliphilus]
MNLAIDYIISLTHLYGLVHKDKVVEIYNMQNDDHISVEALVENAQDHSDDLRAKFVEIYKDYFVHETIIEFNDFELELMKRKGKPFYIPKQQELLKYKDDFYFERNREFKALNKYVERNFFKGNTYTAEMVSEEIRDQCEFNFSLNEIFGVFERHGIVFNSESQIGEVMDLIMDLANNVRLWSNNGFTPSELSRIKRVQSEDDREEDSMAQSKSASISKKVGRNDPCPCGSGKKYKKCCLVKG